MWGKKNKTANNAMQRATDASVCVAKSVLVGSWVYFVVVLFLRFVCFFFSFAAMELNQVHTPIPLCY